MNAVKLQVLVPESREVTITLPPEVGPGQVELIVLVPDATGAATGARVLLDGADDWRARHDDRRSKDEIDRYLDDERSAWGER